MRPLLELDRVNAGYGRIRILRDLTFTVPEGSVVALIGPNGVGKTTTLRTIAGLVGISSGTVRLDGRRLNGRSAYQIARAGITLVPEGRGVFPNLTVAENLDVAARAVRGRPGPQRAARIDEVFELFPRLEERRTQRAGTMSGGEQQMLAMARAFLADPRVLLLDEISMGLAPLIVESLYESVANLRDRGITIVMVEQFLTYALKLADICYVMRKGAIAFAGDTGELAATRTEGALTMG